MDHRVIIHVDMDYFYAAVEERDNPDLKGKPVVICVYSGRGGGSGAVSTCNYTARKAGIKAGIPCSTARKHSADAVFLPVNMEYYREVSDNLMELLRSYADIFEQVSIDEAFLDISARTGGDFQTAAETAREIKQAVLKAERLTCSVGVGSNKLIAKIASGFEKPDGLTLITPEGVSKFLAPLEVRELWGVGGTTEAQLHGMGIRTVAGLSRVDPELLVSVFGKKKGAWLADAARGLDNSPVQERGETGQVGRIITFEHDTREPDIIMQRLEAPADDIYAKLKKRGVSFKTVTLRVITADFKAHTRSQTLNTPSMDRDVMLKICKDLLLRFLGENDRALRRAGIRVSNLVGSAGQRSLWDF